MVKSLFPFRGHIEKWTNRLISAVKMPLGIKCMGSASLHMFNCIIYFVLEEIKN
jgi:hypothetical protein